MQKSSVKRYESRRGGMSAGCVGCLVVALVLLALVIGAGIYTWMNWKTWAASLAEQAATAVIDEAELTDEQKAALKVEVTSISTRFKSGELSLEQLGLIFEKLEDSPLIPAGITLAVESGYIAPSSLTDEEKADAKLQVQRFARGVFEKKIDQSKVDAVVAPIAMRTDENNWNFKNPDIVKPEEIKTLADNARREADLAGISSEPFEIDFAAEVRRLVDEAVAESKQGALPGPTGGTPAGGG